MRAQPHRPPWPSYCAPWCTPERSRGWLGASCGASRPALDYPQNGDVRAFNQVVDRDAGTVSFLLEWLRDGEPALLEMPASVLRRLQLEAMHWNMRGLAEQCASSWL